MVFAKNVDFSKHAPLNLSKTNQETWIRFWRSKVLPKDYQCAKYRRLLMGRFRGTSGWSFENLAADFSESMAPSADKLKLFVGPVSGCRWAKNHSPSAFRDRKKRGVPKIFGPRFLGPHASPPLEIWNFKYGFGGLRPCQSATRNSVGWRRNLHQQISIDSLFGWISTQAEQLNLMDTPSHSAW